MSGRYGLELRGLRIDDAAGLAELLREARPGVALAALAERIEAVRRQPGAALVAKAWGTPAGVVVAHWVQTLEQAAPVAAVSLFLVGRGDRRQCVGRLLLKAVSQAARQAGCGELVLWAGDDRPELRAFALATGFEGAGERLSRPLRRRAGGAD